MDPDAPVQPKGSNLELVDFRLLDCLHPLRRTDEQMTVVVANVELVHGKMTVTKCKPCWGIEERGNYSI